MADTTISGSQLFNAQYNTSAYNVVKYSITSESETLITYRIKHGIIFPDYYTRIGGTVIWEASVAAKDDQTSLVGINSFGGKKTIRSQEFEANSSDNFYCYSSEVFRYTKTTSSQVRYFQTNSGTLKIKTINGSSDNVIDPYYNSQTSTDFQNKEAVLTLTIPALRQCTVTFLANGHGTAPAAQTIYYGYTASTPTPPTATGWTFGGWYTESTCTNAYNFNTAVTGNIKLYAKWTVNTYTITYNDHGGTGTAHVTTQSKKYNAAVTLHSATQDGFIKFDTTSTGAVRRWLIKSTGGWNTKSDGTGTSYNPGSQLAANTISSNITLYAQWEATYIYPTITNLTAWRTTTDSSYDEDDDGEYLRIAFNWTGYSNNNGSSFSTPTCQITIDGTAKTVTLTGTSPNNFVYRPTNPSIYSSDETHTIAINLYDPNNTSHKATASISIPTAVLPIDLYSDSSGVYMGIMHPYKVGQTVTTSDLYADSLRIVINESAGSTEIDGQLYTALNNTMWSGVLES